MVRSDFPFEKSHMLYRTVTITANGSFSLNHQQGLCINVCNSVISINKWICIFPRYLVINRRTMVHISPLKEACQLEIMSVNHNRRAVLSDQTIPAQSIIHHSSP